MNKKLLPIILIFVFLLIAPAFAMFKIPKPVGYVNDFANVISADQKAQLNSIILELKQKTQAEIVVVTLNSLDGYPIEDVSLEIGRQWKVGQKGKDNGVIILVAPNDKKMRIETGYGTEGVIPDSKAGRIRDTYMIPYFKTGNYGKGILLGTAAVASAIAKDSGVTISGNYNYQKKASGRSHRKSNPFSNILFIVIFLFFAIKYPRFTLLMLLYSGGGGRGGSSGGFGGFSGGGGFGGGGASGGW